MRAHEYINHLNREIDRLSGEIIKLSREKNMVWGEWLKVLDKHAAVSRIMDKHGPDYHLANADTAEIEGTDTE